MRVGSLGLRFDIGVRGRWEKLDGIQLMKIERWVRKGELALFREEDEEERERGVETTSTTSLWCVVWSPAVSPPCPVYLVQLWSPTSLIEDW
jgi:hypothetical protein